MKRIFLAVAFLVFLSGCTLVEFTAGTNDATKRVPAAGGVVDSAMTSLEGMTGPLVDPATAEKVEGISAQVETISKTVQGLAETTKNFIPEDKKPIAEALIGVLGLLGAGAGALAGVMRSRKNAMKNTLIAVAESVHGGGKAVTQIAPLYGTSSEIQQTYESKLSAGVVAPLKSTNSNSEASA